MDSQKSSRINGMKLILKKNILDNDVIFEYDENDSVEAEFNKITNSIAELNNQYYDLENQLNKKNEEI